MTNEPLTHALDVANTLLRLLIDLLEDDGCEDDARVTPRLIRARQHAQHAVNELQEVVR